MARRRRPNYYNRDWKTGLTAAEINARDSDGNLIDPDADVKYNTAAAVQGRAVEGRPMFATERERMLATEEGADLAGAKMQQQKDYAALGNALGIKINTNSSVWDEKQQKYVRPIQPSFDQLKAEFLSRPSSEQAKIYVQGQAPFIGGVEGAKLIQGLQKTREESFNTGINSMVSQITRGEVVLNPADRKFYRTVKTKDLAGNETSQQVPISLLEAKYINEGMKRGMMPDVDMFRQAAEAQGTAPAAAALVDTKNLPPNGLEHPMMNFPSMAEANVGAVPLSSDPATRLGQSLRSQVTTGAPGLLTNIGHRINDFGATFPGDARNAGRMGVNALTSALNAVGRFTGAVADSPVAQIPQMDYEPVVSPLLVQPQRDAAYRAAIAEANSPFEMPTPMPMRQPTPTMADTAAALRAKISTQDPDSQAAYNEWLAERGF